MVCDANGVPLRFLLSAGQASDISNAQTLLSQIRIPGKQGRPRKRCCWVLADKGYDAEHLRQYCDRYGTQPVIPQRTMKSQAQTGTASTVRPPKIPATKHQRANVRLAERESQDLHSLRKAGKKFCRHGHTGMRTAVPTAVLFGQNLKARRSAPYNYPQTQILNSIIAPPENTT